MTHAAPHHMPRAYLLDSTFWQVLPAHYDKISNRWKLIAHLYYEAGSVIMATDRAAASNSLKAELEMLDNDIKEYRDRVADIALEDIMGIYILAGRQRWRSEQIARENFEDVERSFKQVEEKIREIKANIVYGFE